jgi:CBS domain-containing protein
MNRVTLVDVMTRDFVGVSESDDIAAAARTMRDAGETTAVVLRGTDAVGVVTAGAILDFLVDPAETEGTIADIMARSPPTLRPEADLEEAIVELSRADTDALLVASGDGVLGVVAPRDVATVPREPASADVSVDEAVVAQQTASAGEAVEADSYSSQSICEACGSLARELTNVNGQLLCADCRGM